MTASGRELGVFLYDLLVAANNHLPEVGGQYATAIRGLDRTDDGLRGAFARAPELRAGVYGTAYQPWVELRDELSLTLATNRTNLEATSDALVLATEVYAAADGEAAAEFRRLRADPDYGEPRPGDNGVVPPPGAPGGTP